MKVTTYRVPPAFLADHISRDLLPREDAVVKETKSYVVVQLTDEERDELLSDARHYADPVNGYRADYPGLVQSAAATVRTIVRQMEADVEKEEKVEKVEHRAVEPIGASVHAERGEYLDERGVIRYCKACDERTRATRHSCGLRGLQDMLSF